MANVSYNTWPQTIIDANTVNNPWFEPFDFLASNIVADKPSFTDAKGNFWESTNGATVSGDPFAIENQLIIEQYTSENHQTIAEVYSSTDAKTGKMTGVRGIYFESANNAYATNPRLSSCAILYKHVKTNAVMYYPLQFDDGTENYTLDLYKINPINIDEGTTWKPQRWVLSAFSSAPWLNQDLVWLGAAWSMKVQKATGGAAKGRCYIRKLRPIVDVGSNPEMVTASNSNRIVWGHFT